MNIKEKNDITDKEIYKNDSYSKDNNITNIINNELKKENKDYIKDLFNKIMYEKNIIEEINKFEENISSGLTKLNNIKTNNNISILDMKNQLKNEKFKNSEKYQEILSLLNKRIKVNKNKYNFVLNFSSHTKKDKIDNLLNSFNKNDYIKNTNYIFNRQKIIEPKLFIRKMIHSNFNEKKNIKNKLYISCIDGKAIFNGKRSELRYSLNNNISRKNSNSSIFEKSKISETNNFFNSINNGFFSNHRIKLKSSDNDLKIKKRLSFKRNYESFNKGFFEQKLIKIESNLFKRRI